MIDENEHGLDRLARALAKYFSEDDAQNLAGLLSIVCKADSVTYAEIDFADDSKLDTILLAYQKRFLLPLNSMSGSAWEDKIFSFAEDESYYSPRLVKLLVTKAEQTGQWDRDAALREVLKETGDSDVERSIEFLNYIIGLAGNYRVEVKEMQAVNAEFDFRLDMHDVIDRFIRCGIMGPITQASLRTGSPIYEVHPCLRWDFNNG